MASWPNVRLLDFNNDNPPPCDQVFLDGLQDGIIRPARCVTGSDIYVADEFTGLAPNSDWENTGGVTCGSDDTHGAGGVATFLATVGTTQQRIRTQKLPLATTDDFEFLVIASAAPTGVNGFAIAGLPDEAGGGAGFYFAADFATGHWLYKYNGLSHDPGVAWNANTYHRLACQRIGGVLTFSINDANTFALADATAGTLRLRVDAFYSGNNQLLNADAVRCRIHR